MTETAEPIECDQCLTSLGPIDCVIAFTDAKPGEEGTDYEEVKSLSPLSTTGKDSHVRVAQG